MFNIVILENIGKNILKVVSLYKNWDRFTFKHKQL